MQFERYSFPMTPRIWFCHASKHHLRGFPSVVGIAPALLTVRIINAVYRTNNYIYIYIYILIYLYCSPRAVKCEQHIRQTKGLQALANFFMRISMRNCHANILCRSCFLLECIFKIFLNLLFFFMLFTYSGIF